MMTAVQQNEGYKRLDCMTKKQCNCFFIIIISLLIVNFHKPADCEEFIFCTPNLENQKIFKTSHAILKEAFSQLGYNFKLFTHPAKRCSAEVNSGKIDGDSHRIFNYNSQNEYPDLIRVEASIQSIDMSVFTKRVGIKPSGWGSIKQFKILYLYGIKIIELGLSGAKVPPENIIPVFSHEEAFWQLNLDRGDLIIVNSDTGNSVLKKLNLTDSGIKMVAPPLITVYLYPYMHKRHKMTAKKLALTINEMKKEGVFQKIINNLSN